MAIKKIFTRGIYKENPVFRLVLGLCPSLAVSSSVENALGMGFAASAVLITSNIIVSLFSKFIPDKIRIPCYIVIIASAVTVVEMLMEAFAPALHKSLGIFVPLIVVNCIILGRAEAFASKNNVVRSAADGLGMGLGFTLALFLIALVREILGNGTFLGFSLFGPSYSPVLLMILPPGAFITLGLYLALFNYLDIKKQERDRS